MALVAAVTLLLAACGDDTPSEAGGSGDAGGCEAGASVTLDSGLEYEELECGTRTEAAKGDLVHVHYTGTLEDGTEFDSSIGGEPIQAVLDTGSLIEGWVEGIPGMKEGGRRTLVIPSELGYGKAGYPPDIPPDATLIFEVELVDVVES